MMKSVEAFRTIGEVADDLDVPKHVLRFWEGKFPQIRPMKRGGGRRYYRPEDLELLRGIRHLLHAEGYTIKGVQKILREQGVDQVKSASRAALALEQSEVTKKKRGRAPLIEPPKAVAIAAAAATRAARGASNKDLLASAIRELESIRDLLKSHPAPAVEVAAVPVSGPRRAVVTGQRGRPAFENPAALEVIVVDLAQSMQMLFAEELRQARLSDDEVARATARHAIDAGEWRASRIALRIVIERWAGAAARRQPFIIEQGGRPRLPASALHFSISHSGGAALIAISRSGPLGVDVELQSRQLRFPADREARLIAAASRLRVYGQPADRSAPPCGLRAWVRLEAAAKASGDGMGRVLTDAGLVGGAGRADAPFALAGIEVRDIDAGPGLMASVAAARLPDVIDVRDFPRCEASLGEFCRNAADDRR